MISAIGMIIRLFTFLLAVSVLLMQSAPLFSQEIYDETYEGETVINEHLDSIVSEALDLTPVTQQDYRFNPKQLIAPGIMLGAGIAGVWGFSGFKNHIHNNLSIVKFKNKTTVDNYLQYAPIPFYLGLGFIPGVKTRGTFTDRVMAGVTAYAVMALVNNVMKFSFREKRPDSNQRNSFPSGHTATAFTGAELMRIEYGNGVGLAAYVVAGSVGILRIYNDRHWINDVIGGAAVGILSARIAYWLLPWERKLFKLDKRNAKESVSVMPMIGATNGISFSAEF